MTTTQSLTQCYNCPDNKAEIAALIKRLQMLRDVVGKPVNCIMLNVVGDKADIVIKWAGLVLQEQLSQHVIDYGYVVKIDTDNMPAGVTVSGWVNLPDQIIASYNNHHGALLYIALCWQLGCYDIAAKHNNWTGCTAISHPLTHRITTDARRLKPLHRSDITLLTDYSRGDCASACGCIAASLLIRKAGIITIPNRKAARDYAQQINPQLTAAPEQSIELPAWLQRRAGGLSCATPRYDLRGIKRIKRAGGRWCAETRVWFIKQVNLLLIQDLIKIYGK